MQALVQLLSLRKLTFIIIIIVPASAPFAAFAAILWRREEPRIFHYNAILLASLSLYNQYTIGDTE